MIEWTGIDHYVLLGAVSALAIAVLRMLAKTSNSLSATSDALKSHMELNRKLNDELAASYEERRLLRIDKQRLEERLDAVEEELEGLQTENGRLGDEIKRLTLELENQNTQNTIVKKALADQISKLKNALQVERIDRHAVENELRAEIAKLAEENAKLREENAKLAEENSRLRKEVDELSSIIGSIRPDYPNGEEHRDEH